MCVCVSLQNVYMLLHFEDTGKVTNSTSFGCVQMKTWVMLSICTLWVISSAAINWLSFKTYVDLHHLEIWSLVYKGHTFLPMSPSLSTIRPTIVRSYIKRTKEQLKEHDDNSLKKTTMQCRQKARRRKSEKLIINKVSLVKQSKESFSCF